MSQEGNRPSTQARDWRSLSLVRAPLESFYSKAFYREVGTSWRGMAFVYLLLVLAICWLPFLIEIHRDWSRFMGTQAERYLEQIPAVTILNGVVSVDVPQPHSIRDPDTGKVLIIIDTTGQVQSLDGVDARILVTRKQVIARKGESETRIYDLPAVKNFAIDRDRVRTWMKAGAAWCPPAAYLLMLLLSCVYRVLLALVIAFAYLCLGLKANGAPRSIQNAGETPR